MKLTNDNRTLGDRMRWSWLRLAMQTGLCAVIMCMAGVSARAQGVSTTTVQGTVYLATGQAAGGTLAVSWPAFTTAAGQLVAAGKTTVAIGADGFLSVNLAPNLGATPAGEYYTAIFYLSDGSVNTQYWVVPAAGQASLAQVQAQVMPAAQAVQAVNKAYVDQAVSQALSTQITTSGGNLTGPLYLSGDPTQPLQAADKHYVDASVSGAMPLTGGAATGPLTATQLGAAYQVDQFPGADFGAKLQACLSAVSGTNGGTCDARNFTGTQSMGSNLTISTANTTVDLPCATIATANQVMVTAGTRNVSLRGGSAADGNVGGTVFQYSGTGPMVQVGDPAYLADTPGFHLDNVEINTTGATSATAQGLAAYRTQEMDVESVYFLGNANQTGMTLDGTGNYTGGTFFDNAFNGFGTAVNAIGHQIANAATTDWLNASTFVRLHIVCPTSGGYPIAGTIGVNLQQGDGNTFTGGDVEGCATALHLGANAQNNTIMGLRNENSTNQVVADAGSAYNNWISGGTMFTGKLTDNGTRNSFLDSFHRSFNGMNGDWYGSQQDATVTNHYRLGTGTGNERGLLKRYQTDYGYRWTTGPTDATSGEQFFQIKDELNNVNRFSVGQYLSAAANTVTNVMVNNGGCYSSNAAPVVAFADGGGTGAAATANMVASSCSGGWTVGSVTMTNNGSGYTSQPAITFSGSNQVSSPSAVAEISTAGSTNNQTVLNSAGTGAVVLNASNNAGTGGVVFGSGGPSETTVATINNVGNAQFNGTLQVGGASTFTGTTMVKNQADGEIDSILQAGLTASQKESLIYRDFTGTSQWYMVKDQNNNWALNSAMGNLDSFKAYQSTNSGDTYINAAKSTGVVRVNYETGAGTAFNIYGGSSSNLYASFGAANAIKFPGLAASSGSNCLQIDNSGYISNTGSPCGSGSGGGSGTVGAGTTGQIAYYTGNGTTLGGMDAIPVSAGGTGATTAAAALSALLPGASADQYGNAMMPSVTEGNSAVVKAVVKNDNATDISPALQTAWNAAPIGGTVVLNCKSPGCYWQDEPAFNWGNSGKTLAIEGVVRTDSTIALPENVGINLIAAGAGNQVPQFGSNAPWASINGANATTTLQTAVNTPDGTADTVNVTFGSMTGIYPGSMLTFAENTSCNISSITRSNNLVTATFSSYCDIPPGVPVTVAGVADASFNGSHANGQMGGPFMSNDADDVLYTLTWQQAGADGASTGGTVSGLKENSVEDVPVTSCNYGNNTCTLTFYRTHSLGSQVGLVGLWVYGNNYANVIKGINVQSSGTAFVIDSYTPILDHIGTNQTGACSGNLTAMGLAVRTNGAYVHIQDGSAIDAWCDPYSVHEYSEYNAGYATAGPIYIENSFFSRGIKADHGGGSIFLTNFTCDRCGRAAVTFDPTNYWNGNQMVISENSVQFNDDTEQFPNYDYYQTVPIGNNNTSMCPIVTVSGNYGSRSNANAYACKLNTTFPTYYGNRGVQSQGIIGTFNNGDQIDGEIRGAQASFGPAVVPYPTLNVPVNPSIWTGSCTEITGIPGPDGSTTSAAAFTSSTNGAYDNIATINIGTPIVGEVFLFGAWNYTPTPGEAAATTGLGGAISLLNNNSTHYAFNYGTPGGGYSDAFADDPGIIGDWWHSTSGLGLVTYTDGTGNQTVSLSLGCDSVRTMEYAYPWIIDIKPVQSTSTVSSGSASVSLGSGTGILNGMEVWGSGIQPGTTVASGGGTTNITLSQTATATGTPTLTFQYPMAEIERWKRQLMHGYVPPNASAPANTLYIDPNKKLSFGTQTNVYSGPNSSVKTDQAFDAVNGYKCNGSYGASGQYLQTTGSGCQWANVSGSVPAVPSWLLWQGDGSGGAFSCTSGTCAMRGENWYSSVTISSGATAYQSDYNQAYYSGPLVIRSTGTCTIAGTLSASPNFSASGNNSTSFGAAPGGGGGGGTAAGSSGSSSGNNTVVGSAGAASGGTGGNAGNPDARDYDFLIAGSPYTTTNYNLPYGGAKGGNGGSGGGTGGSGGGGIVLDCQTINFTGTIDVSGAAGGNATANNTGAAGGGGGGFVILRSPNLINSGTIKVSGGAGGSCGSYTGCGPGGTGGSGWSKVLAQ
ncbi:MAG TPA: hypothetical protein VGR47_08030 [Terracidiphilus sp.]|nr:hypothetical protein [Terracidiphilus sp.]